MTKHRLIAPYRANSRLAEATRPALSALALGLALSWSGTAHAGEAAEEAYTRGLQLQSEEKMEQAVDAYAAAYRMAPDAMYACLLGRLEERLGRTLPGSEHLRICFEKESVRHEPDRRAAMAQLAMVLLRVLPDEAGSPRITVNGAPRGTVPNDFAVFVRPDKEFRILVENDGWKPAVVKGTLLGGSKRIIEVKLVRETDVKAESVSQEVKGTSTGSAPQPKQRSSYVGPLVMGSVGAVALVAGAVLVGVGRAQSSSAEQAQFDFGAANPGVPCEPSRGCNAKADAESGDSLSNVGVVLAGLGAAIGIGATTWFFLTPAPTTAGWHLTPAPRNAGVSLNYRF